MIDSSQRIDCYLAAKYDLSRSYIQKLIKQGNISYQAKKLKPAANVSEIVFSELIVTIPEPEKLDVKAENIDIEIVYQDSDLAVVKKPSGMVVHPSAGHSSGTLVNALLFHLKDLSGIGGVFRPGIVHRLDKDTTGLLIVAKNDKTHRVLSEMFKTKNIEKRYRALLNGIMSADSGSIENDLGRSSKDRKKVAVVDKGTGKYALTTFEKIGVANNNTLVDIRLHTGRTHQIRVHFANIGFPLVGDPVYQTRKNRGKGQFLIAYYLRFNHPITGKELEIKIDLPPWAK